MIELKNLVKTYGDTNAVDNLSLRIEKGEVFGLLGPNGAGKSTTILMLCGLIQPTSGECLIDGIEVSKNPIEVKRRLGYMPEDVGFYPNLSAGRNLDFFAKLNDIPDTERKERIEVLLRLVGLSGVEKKVGGYSKGMRQRLGIAKALVNDPDVVILDEPTANLDPQGVSDYRRIIRNIAGSGKTILVSSHILSEVSKVCSRVGIMQKGKLVRDGSWDEITRNLDLLGLPEIIINVETESGMPELIHEDIIRVDYFAERTKARISASKDIRADIGRTLYKSGTFPKEICLDAVTTEDAVLSYYNG
ncbi:ABC transporter related protein [Methanolacinia petrolearia DSM 11571]|uniref:ABC transporter related protein n=1 Tax=Methanolacinia petrolearia (strain DSM 11571 / OCM 486 / SEBR 4847) TaxID=679926 RepID=E1RH47_METP4|nr:ABC transporter ATP-binding protein [Methanolacinia petrolearia]ADN35271.1 ABC transporter related protein [Methanolacinia petrolearia DSM 11571]